MRHFQKTIERTARREHTCRDCGKMIEQKERYILLKEAAYKERWAERVFKNVEHKVCRGCAAAGGYIKGEQEHEGATINI
jgi:hypothetical protein